MNVDTTEMPVHGDRDDKRAQAESFSTLADVLECLERSGWKVTKTSLYRHQKEGKILPGPEGAYLRRDVEKYARTWLKQASTGRRVSDRMDELQRRKLEIELENLELDRKRKLNAYQKDIGEFISKKQAETDRAILTGILAVGLFRWVDLTAAQVIRLVNGDMQKVGELRFMMRREVEDLLNSYAAPIDFEVVVDAEDDAEGASGSEDRAESDVKPC